MRLVGQFPTFYFFSQKDFTHTKGTKAQKAQKRSQEKAQKRK